MISELTENDPETLRKDKHMFNIIYLMNNENINLMNIEYVFLTKINTNEYLKL